MKSPSPIAGAERITCISQKSIFLNLFSIALILLSTPAFSQEPGETCSTALPVTFDLYATLATTFSDGPSSGYGAVNLCSFPNSGGATHADWYIFTAPANGTITVSTCGRGVSTRLSIFTGNCTVLNCVASSDSPCPDDLFSGTHSSLLSDMTVYAGTTYYIQWDDSWSSSEFVWTLEFNAVVPSNNSPCAGAQIGCGDSKFGTTYGATNSGFPLNCDGSPTGSDVFYYLDASIGETYTITLNAPNFDTNLSAYNGDCLGISTILACNDNPVSGAIESITFTVTDNNDVYIRVYDNHDAGGNFDLTVACASVTNDACSDAENIIPDGPVIEGSNFQATPGPDLSTNCAINGGTATQHAVWYRFLAPITGKVIIETFAGTLTDTQLQLYDACGGEVLACDDNGGAGLMSKITLDCDTYSSSQFYYVMVNGSDGQEGTFDISIVTEACDAPVNDACANAILIPVNGTELDATNSGATGSSDLSIYCGGENETASTNDVWFYFIAPSTGVLTIETFEGGLHDSQLQILDACNGNVIACDEDSGEGYMSKINLDCVSYIPGHTYFIQVDGWYERVGSFGISVSTSPCPPPTNDGCSNPEVLTVHALGDCAGNEVIGTTNGAVADYWNLNCVSYGPDVFYSFNSGNNTSVVINVDAITGTQPSISAFLGGCNGSLLLCSETGATVLEVNPNTVYLVRISTGSFAGSPEVFNTFNICIEGGYDCFDLQANIGDACDDGDPLTGNDVLIVGCSCQGTLINDDCSDATTLSVHAPGDCAGNETLGTTTTALPTLNATCEPASPDVYYTFNSGAYESISLNLHTITADDLVLSVLDGSCGASALVSCSIGINQALNVDVNPGQTYIVRIHSYSALFSGEFNICIEGIYNCPALSANIGDSCDDGDPNTENDVVTSSCICEGTSASSGTLSGTIPSWNSGCGSRDVTIGLAQPAAGFYDGLYGTLNADGSIDIDGSPEIIAGTYTVFVDVQGALVKSVGEVVISSGTNTFSVPPLTFGDLNNDNAINISDISQFITTFGSAIGDSNYDPLADFDCSGSINIADLSSLTNNFGLSGDNLIL